MIVIPAIDIKNGKCVRLLQGRMDAETVFSDDPAAMGARWAAEGARLIHVVDLDGAVDKRPVNLRTIRDIIDRVHVPIQVGGGIRDMETIRMYMDQGVSRVVIGTEAIKNPDLVKNACREFPDRIVVGIDAKGGMVAIEGWTQTTGVTAVDLARQFEGCGVAAINFTDIERDGMRTGPNLKETEKLAASISIPVVASGGVSSIEDIIHLAPLEAAGVVGVITGRALYDGSLDLKAAIAILSRH
ncbi:MAG: 1-(5-phosphoribosyl)-5-[(5-phosphoribosylamino)methylideneamino]imidazole-4-carboxamide isomerase [Desulfobacteraceae bacterium]|nr:1-(5-phosphoribosyl)-5-[(5-phosphoribosylamino)methylideneamino]imidazole-4-carboxamide isomerase [Desulfobacteraceae bacterium]